MRQRTDMRSSLLLLISAVAFAAFGQQPAVHVEPAVFVTVIDVVADVRDASGKVPSGLTADDFTVMEEGVEQKVIGVDYLRAQRVAAPPRTDRQEPAAESESTSEWQIVVYFETQLSSGTNRKTVAKALIKQIDQLVRIGSVDVVLASPTPAPLVRGSRDPEAIRQALQKVATHNESNWLVAHRRDFYTTVQMGVSRDGITTVPANAVMPQIDDEILMISRFRNNLMSWLSTYGRHVPRTLLIVTDGFDLDPVDFYGFALSSHQQDMVRAYLQRSELGQSMDRLARALAAGGWTTVSIPGEITSGTGWFNDASASGTGRIRELRTADPQISTTPKSFLSRPLEPLILIADSTGGKVVSNYSKIAEMIADLDDRVRLTYQVARPPDGKARKIEIVSRRPHVKVRSMQWAASSAPDEMAEARALGLLKADIPGGDLEVTSSVVWHAATTRRMGTLYGAANLAPIARVLPQGATTAFRVTLAVKVSPTSAFVVNRLVTEFDRAAPAFTFRAPADVPLDASLIVVTIEEINTGMWGSARVEIK